MRLDLWDPSKKKRRNPGSDRTLLGGVQLTVQFQMQKGCETHFQASHPWRTYARVYVNSVNVPCLKTDTPFRCATGLRHVPLKLALPQSNEFPFDPLTPRSPRASAANESAERRNERASRVRFNPIQVRYRTAPRPVV